MFPAGSPVAASPVAALSITARTYTVTLQASGSRLAVMVRNDGKVLRGNATRTALVVKLDGKRFNAVASRIAALAKGNAYTRTFGAISIIADTLFRATGHKVQANATRAASWARQIFVSQRPQANAGGSSSDSLSTAHGIQGSVGVSASDNAQTGKGLFGNAAVAAWDVLSTGHITQALGIGATSVARGVGHFVYGNATRVAALIRRAGSFRRGTATVVKRLTRSTGAKRRANASRVGTIRRATARKFIASATRASTLVRFASRAFLVDAQIEGLRTLSTTKYFDAGDTFFGGPVAGGAVGSGPVAGPDHGFGGIRAYGAFNYMPGRTMNAESNTEPGLATVKAFGRILQATANVITDTTRDVSRAVQANATRVVSFIRATTYRDFYQAQVLRAVTRVSRTGHRTQANANRVVTEILNTGKRLLGNAIRETSTVRDTARRFLGLATQDPAPFYPAYVNDIVAWPSSNTGGLLLSSDVTIAPDGSTTADLIQRSITGPNYIGRGITKGTTPRLVYAAASFKMNDARYATFRIQGNYPGSVDAIFDLQNGIVRSVNVYGTFSQGTASISPDDNGFYRCYVQAMSDTANVATTYVSVNRNGVSIDGTDGSSSVSAYVWGIANGLAGSAALSRDIAREFDAFVATMQRFMRATGRRIQAQSSRIASFARSLDAFRTLMAASALGVAINRVMPQHAETDVLLSTAYALETDKALQALASRVVNIRKSVARRFNATATRIATTRRAMNRALDNPTATVEAVLYRVLPNTSTVDASIITNLGNNTGKWLAGAADPVASFDRLASMARSLQAQASRVVSIRRALTRSLSVARTATGSIRKAMGAVRRANATRNSTLTRALAKFINGVSPIPISSLYRSTARDAFTENGATGYLIRSALRLFQVEADGRARDALMAARKFQVQVSRVATASRNAGKRQQALASTAKYIRHNIDKTLQSVATALGYIVLDVAKFLNVGDALWGGPVAGGPVGASPVAAGDHWFGGVRALANVNSQVTYTFLGNAGGEGSLDTQKFFGKVALALANADATLQLYTAKFFYANATASGAVTTAKAFFRTLQANSYVVDTLVRAVAITRRAASSAAATEVLNTARRFQGNASAVASRVLRTSKIIVSLQSSSASIRRALSRALAANASAQSALARLLTKLAQAQASGVATLSRLYSGGRILQAPANRVATLTRSTTDRSLANTGGSGNLNRLTTRGAYTALANTVESLVRSTGKLLYGNAAGFGSLYRGLAKFINADAATISSLRRAMTSTERATANVSSTTVRQPGKLALALASAQATFSRVAAMVRTLLANAGAIASANKVGARVFQASASAIETLARQAGKLTLANATTSNRLVRAIAHFINDAASASATLQRSLTKVAIQAQASRVASLVRRSGKMLYAIATGNAAINLGMPYRINALAGASASLLRSTARYYAAQAAATASEALRTGKPLQALASGASRLSNAVARRFQALAAQTSTIRRALAKFISVSTAPFETVIRSSTRKAQASAAGVAYEAGVTLKVLQAQAAAAGRYARLFIKNLFAGDSFRGGPVAGGPVGSGPVAGPDHWFGGVTVYGLLTRETDKPLNGQGAGIADIPAMVKGFGKLLPLAIGAVGSLRRGTSRFFRGNAAGSTYTTQIKAFLRSALANASRVATVVRMTGHNVSDTTAPSATLAKGLQSFRYLYALSANVATLVRYTAVVRFANASRAGSLRRATAITRLANASRVALLVRYASRYFNANAGAVATRANTFFRAMQAQATATLSRVMQTGKVLQGFGAQTATVRRGIARFFSVAISIVDTLTKRYAHTYQASSSRAVSLIRQPGKLLLANATRTTSIVRQVGKLLLSNQSPLSIFIRNSARMTQISIAVVATQNHQVPRFLNTVTNVIARVTRPTMKLAFALANQVTFIERDMEKSVQANAARAASLMRYTSRAFQASATVALSNLRNFLSRGQISVGMIATERHLPGKRVQSDQAAVATVYKWVPKFFAANVISVASLVRSSLRSLQVQSNGLGSLVRGVARIFSGNASAQVSDQLTTGKRLTTQSALVATLNRIQLYIRAFLANSGSVASLRRSLARALQAAASTTQTIVRSTGLSRGDDLNTSGSLVRMPTKPLQVTATQVSYAYKGVYRYLQAVANTFAFRIADYAFTMQAMAAVVATRFNLNSGPSLIQGYANATGGLNRMNTRTLAAVSANMASVYKNLPRVITDTAGAVSSLARSTAKSIQEDAQTVSFIRRSVAKYLIEEVTVNTAFGRTLAQTYVVYATAAARITRDSSKRLASAAHVSSTLARLASIGRVLQASAVPNANMFRSLARQIDARAFTIKAFRRDIGKVLVTNSAQTASALKAIASMRYANAAAQGSKQLAVSKLTFGQAGVASTIQRALAKYITNGITLYGNLNRAVTKTFGTGGTLEAKVLRSLGKTIQSSINASASVNRAEAKFVQVAVTVIDTLSLGRYRTYNAVANVPARVAKITSHYATTWVVSAASLVRAVYKPFANAVQVVATIVGNKQAVRAFNATANVITKTVRQFGKVAGAFAGVQLSLVRASSLIRRVNVTISARANKLLTYVAKITTRPVASLLRGRVLQASVSTVTIFYQSTLGRMRRFAVFIRSRLP